MFPNHAVKSRNNTQFTDGTVVIRPYRSGDVVRLYEAVRESIPALMPRMTWCYEGYSMADARRWVEVSPGLWDMDTEYHFAIIDTFQGHFLGGCGLNQLDRKRRFANLGYWVRSGRTGEGIATKAALLTAAFAFDVLKLARISVVAAVDNLASRRVAEKLGAAKNEPVKGYCVVRGVEHEALAYYMRHCDLELPPALIE